LAASAVSTTGMTLGWTRPNSGNDNQGVIVFVGPADSSFTNPIGGTSYTANAAFGSAPAIGLSAYRCVYNGTGSSVAVTGLTSGVNYKVYVMEYNGVKGVSDEKLQYYRVLQLFSQATGVAAINLSTTTTPLSGFTASNLTASAETIIYAEWCLCIRQYHFLYCTITLRNNHSFQVLHILLAFCFLRFREQ
jgi:hypothetical protein